MIHDGQTQRILQRLLHGDEVSAVELHRLGSGKEGGWCGSFSRRISDIRKLGYSVTCRSEMAEGQRHTFYTLKEVEWPNADLSNSRDTNRE